MKKFTARKLTAFLLSAALITSSAMPLCHAQEWDMNNVEGITQNVQTAETEKPDVEYVEGEVIVKFKSDIAQNGFRSFSQDTVQSLNNDGFYVEQTWDLGLNSIDSNVRSYSLNETSNVDMALVKSDSLTTSELISRLESRSDVEYAEPNYMYQASEFGNGTNDPYYDYQWGIENKSNSDSKSGTDMDVNALWNSGVTGSKDDSVIAVLDTGVDYNHPDLVANMWTDTDGTHGYDFCNKDNDPMDDHSHGTHCAGIIAGVGNNGIGVTGVNQNAKIMALKFLGSNGNGNIANAISAMEYVVKKKTSGVNILAVSNSWGGNGNSKALLESMNAVGKKGIMSIVAAGNSAKNMDYQNEYPAGFDSPYILTVGSMTKRDDLSSFSNYSSTKVDVTAPGSEILSTIPTSKATYNPDLTDDNLLFENYTGNERKINFSTSDAKSKTEVTNDCHFVEGGSLKWTINNNETGPYIVSDKVDYSTANKPEYINVNIKTNDENMYNTYIVLLVKTTNKETPWAYVAMNAFSKANGWTNLSGSLKNISDAIDWQNFQIKIEADSTNFSNLSDSTAIYIDNIGLGNTTTPYAYFDGTSMATPMVAGAYNLLHAYNSSWTAEELKARIMGGTVKNSENLVGKSVSDGYVSLSEAINSPDPVLNSLTVSNGTATLNGYFFGSSGKLKIDGAVYPVTSWSDNKIVFDVPDGVVNDHNVIVENSVGSGRNTLSFGSHYNGFESLEFISKNILGDTLMNYNLVSSGSKIYCIGGNFLETSNNDIYEYNINSGIWQKNGAISINMAGVGSCSNVLAVDNKLWFIASEDGTTVSLYTYDTVSKETNKMIDNITKATAIMHLALVDDKIYMLKNGVDTGLFRSESECLVINKNTLSTETKAFDFKKSITKIANIDNKIYMLTSENKKCSFYCFDGTNITEKNTIPNQLENQNPKPAMDIIKNNIVLTGLRDSSNNDTYIYDTQSNTWKAFDKMYSYASENNYTGTVYNNQFYVSTQNDVGECNFKRASLVAPTGWQRLSNGSWQYFYENGTMATGWKNDIPGWEGNWFFFDSDGIMATSWQGNIPGWNGKWFYFNTNGIMLTGWQGNISGWEGNWFYFGTDGTMATGWQGNILGWNGWFYFGTDGVMATGWQGNIPGWNGWFYFNTDGIMATGWQSNIAGWGNSTFFFDKSNGLMYTGKKNIDGQIRIFNEIGQLIA